MSNNIELESAEEVAGRGGLYHLFARLWLSEVDQGMLEELNAAPLRDALEAVGGCVPGHEPAVVSQLELDYCQLFIGPTNHLPPFQSVWQTGQFCGDAVVSMKQFVEIIGYDTGGLSRGLTIDHLGVQFDVMAHLLAGIPLLRRADLVAATELAGSYFQAHLRWPRDLLALAERQAGTDFYRSLMVITRDFLACEAQGLAASFGERSSITTIDERLSP